MLLIPVGIHTYTYFPRVCDYVYVCVSFELVKRCDVSIAACAWLSTSGE